MLSLNMTIGVTKFMRPSEAVVIGIEYRSVTSSLDHMTKEVIMFRDRIQEKYEDLSPRFRTLGNFILENTLDVGFLTATELARRVGVDPATVVRFSQELGYSGYRELSREIKNYINHQLAQRFQKSETQPEGLTGKISVATDELSDRVLDMKADTDQIAEVVENIYAAQRVFITSTSEGQGLASLWSTYLGLLGIQTYFIKATPAQSAILLRDITTEDILIALALGLGPETEVGHLLSAAQERDIQTISITTNPSLLPARQADHNLVVKSKTRAGYPFFDTLSALLSVIWQGLIERDEQEAESRIQTTMEALNHLMEQKDKIPSYDTNALLRFWEQT